VEHSSAAERKDRAMGHATLTLLQGTVDLLILRALQPGPAHRYAGRQQARTEVATWRRYAAAMLKILEPA
jgi:hypothetical protein